MLDEGQHQTSAQFTTNELMTKKLSEYLVKRIRTPFVHTPCCIEDLELALFDSPEWRDHTVQDDNTLLL